MKHNGMAQLLGHARRPFSIPFDNLYPVVFFQALRQAPPDIAAAREDQLAMRFFRPSQFLHHRGNVFCRGNEEDLIVFLDDGVAFGLDRLAIPVDGRHPRFTAVQMLVELAQLLPDQRAAFIGTHRHQLYQAAGKIQHLQGARIFQQALDVFGHQLFGTDQYIDGQTR